MPDFHCDKMYYTIALNQRYASKRIRVNTLERTVARSSINTVRIHWTSFSVSEVSIFGEKEASRSYSIEIDWGNDKKTTTAIKIHFQIELLIMRQIERILLLLPLLLLLQRNRGKKQKIRKKQSSRELIDTNRMRFIFFFSLYIQYTGKLPIIIIASGSFAISLLIIAICFAICCCCRSNKKRELPPADIIPKVQINTVSDIFVLVFHQFFHINFLLARAFSIQ